MRAFLFAAAFLVMPHGHAASNEFELCTLCHGVNANGNNVIRAPKLSGLNAEYLRRQLEAFRSGIRGTHASDVSGSEMRTIALSLSATAIPKAAEFVTRLKARPPAITVAGNAERGQLLYASCAPCHGARGEGNRDFKAPNIADTNDWYVVAQLSNYRSGVRGGATDSDGAPMRAAALALPDAEALNDVAAYLNSLR